MKAIGELVQRIDRGELALDEWLGLEAELSTRFDDDQPKIYTKAELDELLVDNRPGILADLLRNELLERQGDAYLAKSTRLLHGFLGMERSGIDLDVAKQAAEITRLHMSKLAAALGKHYVKSVNNGFGRSAAATDLNEAFGASRALGQTMVHTVFGQEMGKVLRELVESGQMAKLASKKQ
jgi:hypothetical protein